MFWCVTVPRPMFGSHIDGARSSRRAGSRYRYCLVSAATLPERREQRRDVRQRGEERVPEDPPPTRRGRRCRRRRRGGGRRLPGHGRHGRPRRRTASAARTSSVPRAVAAQVNRDACSSAPRLSRSRSSVSREHPVQREDEVLASIDQQPAVLVHDRIGVAGDTRRDRGRPARARLRDRHAPSLARAGWRRPTRSGTDRAAPRR